MWDTGSMITKAAALTACLALGLATPAAASHRGLERTTATWWGPQFYVHAGPTFNSAGGQGAYVVLDPEVPTIAATAPSRAATILLSARVGDKVLPFGYLGGRFKVQEACEGSCPSLWAPLVAVVTRQDGTTRTLRLF